MLPLGEPSGLGLPWAAVCRHHRLQSSTDTCGPACEPSSGVSLHSIPWP